MVWKPQLFFGKKMKWGYEAEVVECTLRFLILSILQLILIALKALDIYQIQVTANGQMSVRPSTMQGVRLKEEKEVLEHFAGVVSIFPWVFLDTLYIHSVICFNVRKFSKQLNKITFKVGATLQPKKPKNHFLAKISVFWAKNAKIFKNKKLIKKVRKHSLATRI